MSSSTMLLFGTLGCTQGCIKIFTKMFMTVYCQCQQYSCNACVEGMAWKNIVIGRPVQTKLAAIGKISNCKVYHVFCAHFL